MKIVNLMWHPSYDLGTEKEFSLKTKEIWMNTDYLHNYCQCKLIVIDMVQDWKYLLIGNTVQNMQNFVHILFVT